MDIKLGELVKSSRTLTITATKEDREHEEGHVIEELKAGITIAGFRKGKAPLRLVREKIGEEKIREHVMSHLLSHGLSDAIKKESLQMVGNPKLTKTDSSGADWVFEVDVPIYPTIKLENYQDKIKKAKSKAKPETEEDKLKVVFDTLLELHKFDVPQILVDEEVDRALTRLVQQTQTLNLSVADYLKSLKKTPESLREEYFQTATESLKLDFLLFAVAKDQKISVTDTEIDNLAKTSEANPDQRSYLQAVLLRRRAVDYLLAL